MAIHDEYEFIANLKGAKGDDGAQGLAGPVAVANDVAFASAVGGISETNTAVAKLASEATLAQSSYDKAIASAAFAGEVSGFGPPTNAAGSPMSGIPDTVLRGVTSLAFPVNTIRYHPFEIHSAVTVTKVKFEVTVAPSVAGYVSTAIYSADALWQPLALMQQVNTVANTSTGPLQSMFAPSKPLPKGRYLLAVASEYALTLRGYRGGPSFAATSLSGVLSQYFEVPATYAATFKELAPHWTSAPTGTEGGVHSILLEWTAQAASLDAMFMLPDRQLVKGANVVVFQEGWDLFWANWAWDTKIKWQIDYAKSAGANTIRVIGDVFAITRYSLMTITEYRARWRQLIDYCASLDMYVYACGGGIPDTNYNTAAVTQVLVELGKEINGDERVIGYDVMQESYSFAITEMDALIPAIRAVCDRKLTFSLPIGASWDVDSAYARNQLRPNVDFYDFHIYYDVSVSDVTAYWDIEGESKPLLFGEFGAALDLGQAAQEARYAAVKSVVAAVRPDGRHCAGGLTWAITDQDTTSDGVRWGMWTDAKAPRQYLIDAFRSFPNHR